MPYILLILLQVACIVHVIKTGRPVIWLLPIFFLPLIGPLVYIAVEILPEYRGHALFRSLGPDAERPGPGRVRKLREQLEAVPTIESRLNLAEALMARGEPDEAARHYEACLTGPNADDGHTRFRYAEALRRLGRYDAALDQLDYVDDLGDHDNRPERRLLRARCLEGEGEVEAARTLLEKIHETFSGEEARYRLARLAQSQGDVDRARELYRAIVAQRSRYTGSMARRQRTWIKAARQALRSLPEPPV